MQASRASKRSLPSSTRRLRRVLPRAGAGEIGLWLVYPDRHLPAASRALAEFLVRELPASFNIRAGKK
jgi:DNA-binding transcriptional LysR family regulator